MEKEIKEYSLKKNLNKSSIVKITRLKLILISFLIFFILIIGVGCRGIFFIPGASYGYYIWEDKDDNIHIAWSIDRKDSRFSGEVRTNGKIIGYEVFEWEESDNILVVDDSRIEFDATLDQYDYSDEIVFTPVDYSYLEFDLKINEGYDLSRINIGEFINSPGNNIFRIEKDYFDRLEKKPWYKKHPFVEFFNKLYASNFFTFVYIFILGIIIIEILRISVFYGKKRKLLIIVASYIVLIFIDVGFYLFLKFIVG